MIAKKSALLKCSGPIMVLFVAVWLFCRMYFKTEKTRPNMEKKPYFNGVFYLFQGTNILLCMAKLQSDGEMLLAFTFSKKAVVFQFSIKKPHVLS